MNITQRINKSYENHRAVTKSGALNFDHIFQAESLNKKVKSLKRNNTPKMESLMLSPMSSNQDLILNYLVSASPKNEILNQSARNYLVTTSESICLIDLCRPLKEGDLATTSSFPSACKVFLFCIGPQSSFLSAR